MRGILTDGLLGLACLAAASCMGCAIPVRVVASCQLAQAELTEHDCRMIAGAVWHGMEERCVYLLQ